ncbi:MAG TPA: hypothetical protein VMZ74_08050 [Ramlibacter sp.]|nr:hypothetical protein [Ramlibacter sp.]
MADLVELPELLPVSLDEDMPVDDVSLLVPVLLVPVPLAPMLVVLLFLELSAVVSVEDVLGAALMLELVLGVALVLAEPLVLPVAPIELELFLLASVVLEVPEALVPPWPALLPDVPALPLPDCANAIPPNARAAAAASVVNVFIMSCSLNG